MFSIGDYVIYGYEGVCKVEEIGHPRMSGLDRSREYYRLTPYYRGGTIYTPVDGRIVMRPVIAKSELESLIPALPKLPLLSDVPADGKLAAAYYREILAQHNCRRLLQLCKTLHAKQTELARNRKSVNATDLRNWKTAEEMVYGEFGFVLGMPPTDVKTFLIRALA